MVYTYIAIYNETIRGPCGNPQGKRIITSCIPFPLSKQLRFHDLQHAISQMITRTCYLQCLLGSLASEREREEEDDIEGEGQSEGAGDAARDEAGQCRPGKKLQDLGI